MAHGPCFKSLSSTDLHCTDELAAASSQDAQVIDCPLLHSGYVWLPETPRRRPPSVDFARDVQPILRQNCISCHGPNQQNADLRVDRKSSVIRGRRVVPGGAANSILLHKLNGDPFYGPQMPPSGPLKPEQIATLTAWIEQGAPWPDALANEADLPPPNPMAVAIVTAMRTGDRRPLMAASADLLNARGPEGSTPFMYAVLYTDAAILECADQEGRERERAERRARHRADVGGLGPGQDARAARRRRSGECEVRRQPHAVDDCRDQAGQRRDRQAAARSRRRM